MSFENKGSMPATVFVTLEPDRSGNFICDGTADDVQIQEAIDYVGTLGGGTVALGRGVFDIAATIVDNGYSNIWLKGQGKFATKLDVTTAGLNPITITSVSGWKLSDFELDGNDQGINDSHGIMMDVCTDMLIVDVWLHHISYATAVAVGIFIRDCTRVDIVRCRVENCDTEGIGIVGWDDGGCYYCNVIDCFLEDNANGAEVASRAAHIVFLAVDSGNANYHCSAINNKCIDSEEHGIQIYHNCHYIDVIGNNVTDFKVEGIAMGRGAGSEQTCTHLVCVGNTVDVEQTDENVTACITSWNDGTVISGNTCEGFTVADTGAVVGILVQEGDYNTVEGNYVTIADAYSAIRVDDSTGTQINGNICVCPDVGSNTFGLRLTNSDYCSGSHNTFVNMSNQRGGTGETFTQFRRNRAIDGNLFNTMMGTPTVISNDANNTKVPFFMGGAAGGADVAQFIHADASPKGWEIDAANEWAIACADMPGDSHQLGRIIIWAVSNVTETDSMMLTIELNGARDNEPFNVNNISVTKACESSNFAANDVIYWVVSRDDDSSMDGIQSSERLEVKVSHAAESGDDVETDVVVSSVTFDFV